eukprot:scaffold78489_cov58-Attheya_sp.AAC.2
MEAGGVTLIFSGAIKLSAITLDAIKDNLPILYCMMENARMASIALKFLRDIVANKNPIVIVEKDIVDHVCALFISSNGISSISRNPVIKNAIGTCAFAVMLFQRNAPDFQGRDKDKNTYRLDLTCGFDFDPSVTRTYIVETQKIAMKKLVSTFGLLKPNDYDTMTTPFKMQPSQQLIALSLLGIDLSQLVHPFGFEVLSTHTMKAALAASSAVAWRDRKSVKETLGKVGCMVDETGTHEDTKCEWEGLKDYFVVCHDYKEDKDGTPMRLLNAELEVCSLGRKGGAIAKGGVTNNDSDSKDGGASASANTSGSSENDGDTKKVLYIEKVYRKDLFDAFPAPAAAQNRIFHPPITAVNYRNSALADGLITCFVAKKEWAKKGEIDSEMIWNIDPVKFTAMNQAKDKLGYSGKPKGPLPIAKLRAHAERCSDPVLDGFFGKKHLLFASTPSSLNLKVKRLGTVEMRWLPRALDESKILMELMATLNSQRTLKNRQKRYTDCVDETGKLVDDDPDDIDDETNNEEYM